jgi:hypothetical protein
MAISTMCSAFLGSSLRLQPSADTMTIYGGPATLEVVARMLAGLWGDYASVTQCDGLMTPNPGSNR